MLLHLQSYKEGWLKFLFRFSKQTTNFSCIPLYASIGVLFMTPKLLLDMVSFKSANDLTANKAFHQLLCCLHDEKIRSPIHIEGPILYFQRSLHFQRHYQS